MRHCVVLLVLTAVAACQTAPARIPIQVTSTPPGASCSAERDGVNIGEVAETPGPLTIEAMKGTVHVTCTKAGYVTAMDEWTPSFSPDRDYVGPGALVVLAVQLAGPPRPPSDWHYPAEFHLDLRPVGDSGQPLPLSGLRLR
jgi:hypothetical protein